MPGLYWKSPGFSATPLALSMMLALACSALAEPSASDNKLLAGNWLGTIKAGAVELRQGVTIKLEADGRLTGTIASLDQDAKAYPLDTVELKDGNVRFELKISKAAFEGKLSADKKEIVGKWLQSGLSLPL